MNLKVVSTLFFLIFTTFLYSAQKLEDVTLKSAVTFNTLCAKCHEGQCSGRLAFDIGSEVASSHIKRYSDDESISKDEIKEFFTLLNYIKKECLLYMPDNIKYKTENLSSFATNSYKKYFIPLDMLKSGNYNLEIKIHEKPLK